MELLLVREIKSKVSTIGKLYVNNEFQCFILEDVDRGLSDNMTVDQIRRQKIFAQTAIPTGYYEVIINFSNRFQKYMPLLLNVKGFSGIRIHSGNYAADTEGCLLTGSGMENDVVTNSRQAFISLMAKLKAVEKDEKIFITIQSSDNT